MPRKRKMDGPADQLDIMRHWHLDKRVPIAMIVAIAMQSFGAVWWASGVNQRVVALETAWTTSAPQADRLSRVEVKVETVQHDVSEIKTDIKSLVARPEPRR